MSAGKLDYASFYSITEGKVCRQFKEPDNETKTRVNKNNKTVHEKFYDYLDGYLTGLEVTDSDFGRQWKITLMDGNQKQVLQISYSSGYSQAFLKMLPNVNLEQKICIIPKLQLLDGGKKKSTMFLTQGGKAVKWFYTKDDPNGLPELSITDGKGQNKGKKIYDDSDIMEFLEEMVKTDIIPNLIQLSDIPDEVKKEVEPAATKNSGWKPIDEPGGEDGTEVVEEEDTTNSSSKLKNSTGTKKTTGSKKTTAKKDTKGSTRKKPF